MKLTLKAYLTALRDEFYPEVTLLERGVNPNVLISRAYRCAKKGYSDYGTSPAHSWITQKGKEMLEQLEKEEA